MNRHFSNCFKVVATVHVTVAVVVLLASTWQGCVARKKDVVMPVAFVVETPVAAVVPPVNYTPPRKEPVAKPVPKPIKKRKKPRRKKKPVKVSDKVVSRSVKKPQTKSLSKKDIRKMLADGAKLGDKTSVPNDEGKCLGRIHNALYRAWVDRPSADGAEGAAPEVKFRFANNGRILSSELVKGSGNPLMDDSVMKAAKAVSRINGLSRDFLNRHRHVITVAFRLE
ncbi:MAG: TonB family protein [Kiritimatiellae bacterium]|nr:TonB family protein [Kiritimatiellia bacterium]